MREGLGLKLYAATTIAIEKQWRNLPETCLFKMLAPKTCRHFVEELSISIIWQATDVYELRACRPISNRALHVPSPYQLCCSLLYRRYAPFLPERTLTLLSVHLYTFSLQCMLATRSTPFWTVSFLLSTMIIVNIVSFGLTLSLLHLQVLPLDLQDIRCMNNKWPG